MKQENEAYIQEKWHDVKRGFWGNNQSFREEQYKLITREREEETELLHETSHVLCQRWKYRCCLFVDRIRLRKEYTLYVTDGNGETMMKYNIHERGNTTNAWFHLWGNAIDETTKEKMKQYFYQKC